MDKKLYIGIIYNLNSSGLKNEDTIKDIIKILQNKYDCVIIPMKSKYPGHASVLAKSVCRMCDILISIGGDGTFDQVIKGTYNEEHNLTFIHLPMGTANDLANTFKLSKDPLKNLEKILDGKTVNYDILTINNIPYAYVAAFGFMTSVASDTPSQWKKKIGRHAYILFGSKEVLKKPQSYNIQYIINGKTYDSDVIVGAISNSMGFAGFELYDDAKVNDGIFEVLFVPNLPKIKVVKELADAAVNKKLLPKKLLYYKTDEIKIKFINHLDNCWNLDGESSLIDDDDITIKVGKQIKVMVTEEAYNAHFI